MTSCTGSARRGFWGFWKSQLVELSPASGEEGWLSLAHRGLAMGAHVLRVARWKSQNRKNVYLSPYVEEPLNSKVIKSFIPELRSLKCFFVLGVGRWKSQNRKNVYLSPYVEEPLNSKVIKSFIPELRSLKCFFVLGVGRWKSQNRKNVYLSPYVEEPLNSKVIKSFVPELISLKCFLFFRIPMFYIYVTNILCTFRISICMGMVQFC